jgi:hypothetical protein
MSIDYQLLIDEAMLSIVRKVLINTSESGLIGEQSFYISFKTDDPEVVLSRNMRNKYPKEITIVLQYQFRDLQVLEDRFSVNIAFGWAAETIIVPFSVLTSFIDPVANFSLQFNRGKENVELESETFAADFDSDKEIKRMKPKLATKTKAFPKDKVQKAGEVIAIDKFRKKSK